MKIKLTVFLLTIGTLILLLVGCKGFGAINNTIPTLQDDKVILNPVNSEYGLNAIDVFINFPGTSEEDRSHLEAMKEIYSQYHYCVSISIKHTQITAIHHLVHVVLGFPELRAHNAVGGVDGQEVIA